MSFFRDRPGPAFYARDLLYRQGISAVPVDAESICRNLGLDILDEDLKPGFDAHLIKASAMRFLPLTVEQGAFVVSEDCRVKWCVRSPSFRYRIRHSTLSQSTRAWALFNAKNTAPWPTRVPASAWVDGAPSDLDFVEDSRFVATARIALTTIAAIDLSEGICIGDECDSDEY